MVFMDTAATIPTGSMAERVKFIGFAYELWVSMFIYPLVAGWIWGGGWVQNLGRSQARQRRC
jgi:Amt family ammonium transporter